MKPARALRIDATPTPKPAKSAVIATVHLINPLTIKALDTARNLGASLTLEYDGRSLVVRSTVE